MQGMFFSWISLVVEGMHTLSLKYFILQIDLKFSLLFYPLDLFSTFHCIQMVPWDSNAFQEDRSLPDLQ